MTPTLISATLWKWPACWLILCGSTQLMSWPCCSLANVVITFVSTNMQNPIATIVIVVLNLRCLAESKLPYECDKSPANVSPDPTFAIVCSYLSIWTHVHTAYIWHLKVRDMIYTQVSNIGGMTCSDDVQRISVFHADCWQVQTCELSSRIDDESAPSNSTYGGWTACAGYVFVWPEVSKNVVLPMIVFDLDYLCEVCCPGFNMLGIKLCWMMDTSHTRCTVSKQ